MLLRVLNINYQFGIKINKDRVVLRFNILFSSDKFNGITKAL